MFTEEPQSGHSFHTHDVGLEYNGFATIKGSRPKRQRWSKFEVCTSLTIAQLHLFLNLSQVTSRVIALCACKCKGISRKRVKQPSAQRLEKRWHRPLVQLSSTLDLLNQRNQRSSRLPEGLDRDHSVAHSPVLLQSLSLVNQLQLVVNKDARTTVPNEGSLATTMSSDGRTVVLVVLQALHGNNCDFREIPHVVRLQLLGATQHFLLRFLLAGEAGHHQIVACPLHLAQGVNVGSRDLRPSWQWVIEGHRVVPVNGQQWPFRILFTQIGPRGFWNCGSRLRCWGPEG